MFFPFQGLIQENNDNYVNCLIDYARLKYSACTFTHLSSFQQRYDIIVCHHDNYHICLLCTILKTEIREQVQIIELIIMQEEPTNEVCKEYQSAF